MSVLKHWKDLELTRYHLIIIFGVWVVMVFIRLANVHFPLYANVTPQWACNHDPAEAHFNMTSKISDSSSSHFINASINLKFSQNCSIYYSCQDENGILAFRSPYFSARQEFNLVCDRAYAASLASSVQFVGALIGSNLFGWISDRFGRKMVLSAIIMAEAVFGFASSFAVGPISLGILRCLTGVFTGGITTVLFVFTLEAVKPKQRVFMRAFATTKILLVPLLYVKQNWRFFLRVTNIIQIPTFLLLVFLIPESVKWATDRNKKNLVIKSQRRIDWINGKTRKAELEHSCEKLNEVCKSENAPLSPALPQTENVLNTADNTVDVNEKSTTSKKKPGLRTLFLSKELRGPTIALCSMWATMTVTASVIRFDSRNLAGDFYLNQVWLGLSALLSSIVLLILDHNCQKALRRRMLYQIPQVIVIILSSVAVACLAAGGKEGAYGSVVTVSAVVTIFFMSFLYHSTILSTGEVFPTEIRASAFGMCSSLSLISTALTPEIVLLRQTWAPGPYVVVVALGMLALVLSYIYQPETHGKQLPANMKDAREAANLKN